MPCLNHAFASFGCDRPAANGRLRSVRSVGWSEHVMPARIGRRLQPLYEKLQPKGFVVLAFPCNQFGGQEPGTPQEIRAFVDGYGVSFPM